MPRTRPFAELAARFARDPIQRERIDTMRRAMKDALAIHDLREQWTASAFGESRIEREE